MHFPCSLCSPHLHLHWPCLVPVHVNLVSVFLLHSFICSGGATGGAVSAVILSSTMKYFTSAGYTLSVLLVIMLAREAQAGVTVVLGGLDGWTNKANVDYNKWLSNYKIKIGDTVQFDNNDSTYHTAVLVDKQAYDTCGNSGVKDSPFVMLPGLNYSRTFTQSGDVYIICDIPGHCIQGQKVYIQVLNSDGTVNTTASQTPGKSAAPQMSGFSWTSQLLMVVVSAFSLIIVVATM